MQLSQIIEDIPEVTSRVQMVVKKLPSVLTGLKYLKKTDKTEALSIGTYIEKMLNSTRSIPQFFLRIELILTQHSMPG